jgi:hypothetical protein
MLPLIAMFCVPFFFKDILRGVPHEKNIIAWCSVISKRLRNTDIEDLGSQNCKNIVQDRYKWWDLEMATKILEAF